ncbi:FUSC family protein [Streptomyces hesseae]|uniref:FUSC family protein n=1 Tax=Streptomyces hesseae TaxID=3075519 RepID=A0ABU2SKA5_9ACTN|nr:FUSC family protein [Streptomyces sp. DSM 40473]MDT0449411.1 FUSC family protein [Streptomyces sp. DSM 40473]
MAKLPPLPVRGLVRLKPAADIWTWPALSAAAAMAVPDVTLLALGRLDLALYTAAGALCALYGHDRPYARRARTLAWLVLGAVAGMGVALTSAALVHSAPLLVLLAALVAAVHKAVCDAARIGPPGNVVLTFLTSTAFFVPQRAAEVPGHLGLVAASGALAWLICMAPGLVRRHGPERIAVARALEAAARGDRHAVLVTAEAARRACAGRPDLEALVAWAERASSEAEGEAEAGRLREVARGLRGRSPVPALPPAGGFAPAPPYRVRNGLITLAATRVALGAALAGWASLALGSSHPHWAVVSAASVVQAHASASWQRGAQRVIGNVVGLALFAALLPIARTGEVVMVAVALALQVAAEATMARNYWLGSVFVTPMALLLGEFAGAHPAGGTMADRGADTVAGAAIGVLVCLLVADGRAVERVEAALGRVREARNDAARDGTQETARVRERLGAALLELRAAVDVAAGERRRHAPPGERIAARVAHEEREGHRALAALHALAPAPAPTPAGG